jgi:HlyD family secretion protein
MKEKTIFPISVIEQSADQVFNEHSRLGGILYMVVLFSIVGALFAINCIYVDVNVQASGIIKPREDHTIVLTTINGFISPRNVILNTHVNVGDTLAIVRSEMISVKLPALQQRKEELHSLISDLKQLTTRDPANVKLLSSIYKQDLLYYLSQWTEAESKRKQAHAAYERARKLFEANVIPLSDYEPIEMDYTLAQNAVSTLIGYQKRQWQADLNSFMNELRDIETQMDQISIQDAESIITAPVSGTILQVQSLFEGMFIPAGQQLAEISPDGDLIAECYVAPEDISYLKTGTKGKVQVSSFNYTEWGMLTATIEEVFDDVSVSSDGRLSFYKVYCSLSNDHLTLKNGYRGYLKKGMAINTNFLITRRTVFQLLYDTINDWLNPNIQRNHE